MATVERVSVEQAGGYLNGATLVATSTPRLSWRISGAPQEWLQDAVELRVSRAAGDQLTSVFGPGQVLIAWPFEPLASRERVGLNVRVLSGGEWTDWSETTVVEAGLLRDSDWSAKWITPGMGGAPEDPAPLLGTDVVVDDGLVHARLYVTALGIVIPRLNGQRVSEDHFAPGWTTYDKILRYQTYDVTEFVTPGANRLDALLGNGWYRGRIASLDVHRGRPYGDELALLAQLELTYADGRTEVVASGPDWGAAPSRVLENDFYDGQTTDLRLPDLPVLDGVVRVITPTVGMLTAPQAPPVRTIEVKKAVSIENSPERPTIIDFGRNVVGWVRLTVQGSAGDEVTVQHAEVLENGELSMRPLRSAKATDRYLLAGGGTERLEPNLTFHGFRYIAVTGVSDLHVHDVDAVIVGSDLELTGEFESSDAALNTLHRNVVWSMRGNFLDVPTDCPQRDERLGWTGDTQVFAPTASALFDVSGFLGSWLNNLAVDQLDDGTVPAAVPRVFGEESTLAGWGDAAVIVPWTLWERFGDAGVLEHQYDSMVRWVERVRSLAGDDNLWRGGTQLGDWLDPLAPPDTPSAAQADPDVVATAYYAHSVELLSHAALVVGRHADSRAYAALAASIREAFCSAFVSVNGIVTSDCQTVYAMALCWDLIADERLRTLAGARLAELVRERDYTVSTGFLGTPLILDALSGSGYDDDAYRLLLSRGNPSWLYAVDMGATTIWERWDSMLPDGSVNPGTMTSFNHYAFGAVADWMHRHIGGLTPTAPGYREILVAPAPGGGITSAHVSHLSPYGPIIVDWRTVEGEFTLDLSLPVGVTARVALPDGSVVADVTHGSHRYDSTVQALAV